MIFSIFFIGLASGQNPYTGDIWPQPQSHFLGQKVYEIDGANFKIVASSGIFFWSGDKTPFIGDFTGLRKKWYSINFSQGKNCCNRNQNGM